MTVDVSNDREHAQAGPWPVRLALARVVDAAFVSERRTFLRPSGRRSATNQDNIERGAAKTGVRRAGPRRAAHEGLQTEF